MGCHVVAPETIRLPLSGGDWIDVKKELNAGEYSDYLNELGARRAFAGILTYVLAWSFTDLQGQPIPFSPALDLEERRATVGAQSKGIVREMVATLNRHELAGDLARDAKKNTPAPSPASNPTPGSVAP